MKSRKGTEEGVSLLIGFIIMVLIITPFIIIYLNSGDSETSMKSTLEGLVKRTQELQSGKNDSMLMTIDSSYFLKAFAKDDEDRPAQCKESACICACEPETYFLISLWGSCAENPECVLFDEKYDFRFSGGEHSYVMSDSETVQIYYQKQDNVIGFCLQPPCISDQLNKALEIFEDFLKKRLQCYGQKGDCICEKFSFGELDDDFDIRMKTDGRLIVVSLYEDTRGFGETLRAQATYIGETMGGYDSFNDRAVEIAKFNFGKDVDDEFEDYIYENSIQLFKSNQGYVAFAKKEGVGFTVLKEKKESCQPIKNEPEEEPSSFKKT